MKEKFSEFFRPDENKIEAIWEDAIISVDANILLNLYRYSEETRDEFLDFLGRLKDKLWISHQASVEFLTARRVEIRNQIEESKEFENSFKDSLKKLKEKKAHPYLSKDTERELNAVCEKVSEELNESRDRHRGLLEEDWILEKLDSLLGGRIGDELENLTEIFQEGGRRYKEQIPPGYKDKDKPTNRQRYGDLLIWKELLKVGKEKDSPVIFVTDDQKEDWFVKDDKKVVGGRPELIREMRKEAGQDALIYTADQFLWRAGKVLEKEVTDETAEEVKRVGRNAWYGAGMSPTTLAMLPEIAARLSEVNRTTNDSVAEIARKLQGSVTPVTDSMKLAAESMRGILAPREMARLSLLAAENPEIMAKLQGRSEEDEDESGEVSSEGE